MAVKPSKIYEHRFARQLCSSAKTTLFILVTAFTALRAGAQSVNDSTYYRITANATGNASQTNDGNTYLYNNALNFTIKKKRYSLNSTNNWVYGQQNNKLTNNDYATILQLNIYTSIPHFYYWGLNSYASSFSLKINNQYQGGAGIAYNLLDNKKFLLNLSDGILFENSDVYLHDTIRDLYSTYRNSFRVMFRYTLANLITFNEATYFQNSFSMKSDYVIQSAFSIEVKIKKWFSVKSDFIYNRFNRTESENRLFDYGVSINKSF